MSSVQPKKSVRKSVQSTLVPKKASVKSTLPGKERGNAQETRAQLLERLTNPQITLRETSVLLGVCSATVRNYCNSGRLAHERTPGGQRRFRLKTVLAFCRERDAAKKKRKR